LGIDEIGHGGNGGDIRDTCSSGDGGNDGGGDKAGDGDSDHDGSCLGGKNHHDDGAYAMGIGMGIGCLIVSFLENNACDI